MPGAVSFFCELFTPRERSICFPPLLPITVTVGRAESTVVGRETTQMLERSGWVPKVPQLTGKSVIDDKCGGTTICVVAALPHILDSGKAGRCVSGRWVFALPLKFALLLNVVIFFLSAIVADSRLPAAVV